jgi:hypothetical protein
MEMLIYVGLAIVMVVCSILLWRLARDGPGE